MTSAKDERAERRAVFENDRRVAREHGFTVHDVATSEADAPRGRYGAIGKEHVTGAGPVPQYWALPETSFPNQAAAVPDEPPLNFQELSQVEPCGTYPEIQESLERLGEAGASSPPSGQPDGGDADAPAGGPVPRRHVLRSRRRPFKQRKKD